MYPVAIIQGRLSPDPEGYFQFFPADWEAEFPSARQLGFSGIEWLIDARNWERNPVFTEEFFRFVRNNADATVTSVSADWFMEVPLWEGDPEEHRSYLRTVIAAAQHTTEKLVLIPFLERHTIQMRELQEQVVRVLSPLTPLLAEAGVRIAFETELATDPLVKFIDSFQSLQFGVYFDTGNCTSYGFDCPHAVQQLAHRIMGVHVKDRKVGATQNVPLGTGDTDFPGIMRALREVGWQGTLIMQAWRGAHYCEDAKAQLHFITELQATLKT